MNTPNLKNVKSWAIFMFFILTFSNLVAVSQFELVTLRARAAAGDNSARYKLGVIIMHSEKQEDIEKMIEYFRTGAKSGHAGCMGKFALYQLNGIGTLAKNQTTGLKMLLEAAALKDPDSLAVLYEIHSMGWYGLSKDVKLASSYLDESCKLKSPLGFGYRAGCYEFGSGGYQKDEQAAKRDYLTCAILIESSSLDLDAPSVQMSLYDSYVRAEKYEEAIKCLDKAFFAGSHTAITSTAVCWQFGMNGHTKDLVKAYACYNLAASLRPERHPKAAQFSEEARDNVAKEMTGSQIAEAQRLSTEMNAKILKY